MHLRLKSVPSPMVRREMIADGVGGVYETPSRLATNGRSKLGESTNHTISGLLTTPFWGAFLEHSMNRWNGKVSGRSMGEFDVSKKKSLA